MACRELRGESGSSTVMALGLIALLLTITVGALAVLSAVRAAHVARSSADLAALAAAVVHQEDPGRVAACAEAERIARRHDVDLVACTDGGGHPLSPRRRGAGAGRREGPCRTSP